MSLINLVKSCPLFFEIYENEIQDFIGNCQVASFEPGQKIITQGEESSEIFIILDGKCEINVLTNNSTKKIAELSVGDLFGEMVLINETKRTANIECLSNVDVLVIEYDTFFSYYLKKPKVFSLLVLNVTRLLTKRLKDANQTIKELSNHQLDKAS